MILDTMFGKFSKTYCTVLQFCINITEESNSSFHVIQSFRDILSHTTVVMSVETVLLDFQVPPSMDDVVYVRDVATVATCVAEALRQDCLEQGCISSAFSYASIYSGPKDCMFTIKHYFREGLITLTLEYFKVTNNLEGTNGVI